MIDVHIPANLFYPELPGGSNQYFRYGPYLRDHGVRLIVHTVRKPHHEDEEVEVAGIVIRRYQVPPGAGLLDELEFVTDRAIEEISRNQGRPACLQPLGTTSGSWSSVSRLWKARFQGVPTCFHFMMVPVREHDRFPASLKEIARMKAILSPYRKMLMCSHVMGRAFTEVAGISPRRIEVIPNGIDLSVFSPVTEARKIELRKKLGLPDSAPLVLFVGSVIERKGVEILVEAWERVHSEIEDARLVVVGSTRPRPTVRGADATASERYFDKVATQVDSLTDPESVIFAGETEQIRDYYQASDLFAFASRREGLPSVLLEAMACGVPCVTAPFIGLPADGEEYGTSGEHFVRSSHDPGVLARDIVALLFDEGARKRMGTKAARWIADTQEMGSAAGRLAEVYRAMVGHGQQEPGPESVSEDQNG